MEESQKECLEKKAQKRTVLKNIRRNSRKISEGALQDYLEKKQKNILEKKFLNKKKSREILETA